MTAMDDVLRAIAEPHRREILHLVQNQELPSGGIAAHFDISRPAISQHLKVLVEAGLVTMRQVGTSRLYRARPEGLKEVRHFVEDFWSSSLLNLKHEAEEDERKTVGRERGAAA